MQNDLEKYLEEKRVQLDVDSPRDDVIWEGIREKLQESKGKNGRPLKTRPLLQIVKIAAVVIILFSVGYITKDIIDRRSIDRKVSLSDINEVLGRRETEYRTLVTLKTEEVKSFSASDDLVVRELFAEIKHLDIVYDQALKDLKEMGYNEKIVNTIFDTYEKKIHLLELIILETNKSGSHEKNGKTNL